MPRGVYSSTFRSPRYGVSVLDVVFSQNFQRIVLVAINVSEELIRHVYATRCRIVINILASVPSQFNEFRRARPSTIWTISAFIESLLPWALLDISIIPPLSIHHQLITKGSCYIPYIY
jgi:hypothetical protein